MLVIETDNLGIQWENDGEIGYSTYNELIDNYCNKKYHTTHDLVTHPNDLPNNEITDYIIGKKENGKYVLVECNNIDYSSLRSIGVISWREVDTF